MRIETVIRRRSGRLCLTLTAGTARILAQAWGIRPEDLPGRGVVIEMEV